jgi:hypothetical protein
MCAGNFLDSDGLKRFSSNVNSKRLAPGHSGSMKLDSQQVLLAGQDGYVYIMIDFEIFQWFKVGFCLTNLIKFRPSENETEMVICTGHSNEVLIYQNGEVNKKFCEKNWEILNFFFFLYRKYRI